TNPASRPRPRKKRENCSRRAAIIAEVKMVRSRIVKIDGALDETQTEQPDIKIKVPLRIAGDRSDVMQSRNFAVHDDLPIKSFPRSMSRHLFHWWPGHFLLKLSKIGISELRHLACDRVAAQVHAIDT